MAVPVSIEPDLLKDSIVEIRYSSELDSSLIPGIVYHLLKKQGLSFSGSYGQPPKVVGHQILVDPPVIFSNDLITCRFVRNSIVFNCKTKYIGWKRYFEEIQMLLKGISSLEIIASYIRIGLRYINVLRDTNVYEKINEELRISLPQYKNDATNIKTEIIDEKFKIKLNVGNDFRIQETNELVSVIDIDVISDIATNDIDVLLTTLHEVHGKEAEVFFSLLRPEFLQTLNPNYDS